MPLIHILDEPTINQIAAGEVVERPSAVVKELIENAMDSGATAITAEIKEGGLSFIRITDNGCGIAKEDIGLAFLRHATSKIRSAEDLLSVTSLGFRGEALSSIAAVAQVELITKTPSALNGFRYLIEGGEEKSLEEIGCPGGTTIIVRNIFYNTPARRKFLKSAMTEAGYISDLMERLMVSHPGVSFKYIVNNQVKLQSSGNNMSKDILYHVYGRDISRELLSVDCTCENFKVTGYIGKPIITRGNRNYENYFINGRYIKSNLITKAIEEAYKPFMMQHKYPFTSLYFEISPSLIDVNVHPQKMEIRLKNGEEIYQSTYQLIKNTLAGKELIPRVLLSSEEEGKAGSKTAVGIGAERIPEPFEANRRKQLEIQENLKANNEGRPFSVSQSVVKPNHQGGQTGSLHVNYEKNSNITDMGKVAEQNQNYKVNVEKDEKTGLPDIVGLSEKDEKIGLPDIVGFSEKDEKTGIKHIVEITDKDVNAGIKAAISENDTADINNSNRNSSDINNPDAVSLVINNLVTDNSDTDKFYTNNSDMNLSDMNNSGVIKADKNKLADPQITVSEQMNLFKDGNSTSDTPFLSKKALAEHRIIGQVFSTYWLVEYKKELYIIDQHAAHEKVLYERIMAAAKAKTYESQQLLPPIVLSLTLREQEVLHKQEEVLNSLGYEIEHFGGNEFSVRAVPADLYGISERGLLLEFIDELTEDNAGNMSGSVSILERVASLSCKAAVKANHTFSTEEASALIKELLTLENPYNCPHGRPVIISMSQYELERKFKRIL